MEMSRVALRGLEALVLDNGVVRAALIPALGGKIASLRHKALDFELMAQPGGDYRLPSLGAAFSDYDASGFDDAFPSVGAAPGLDTPCGRVDYPDHGEIWSARMAAHWDGERIGMCYDSAILPYRYEKFATLMGESLVLEYRITNTGSAPFPMIWTAHGLMRIERDMRFVFPDGPSEALNLFDSPIGPKGILPFPGGLSRPLDRPLGLGRDTAIKYYLVGRMPRGECGALYPSSGVQFTMRYDHLALPYLGLWMTEGGFRGDYNWALEPTNGYYDDIGIAREHGALPELAPGEAFTFTLQLALSEIEGE